MKPHFVAIFLAVSSTAFAQNKTLGVGTTTPNTNAALHVESPTNNQGFIMPRLSTVQRTAIALGVPDAGLMVYDNIINKPFYWDGASWLPAAGLAFPYVATDGSGTASFSITNTATGFASTFLNSGTGGAGQFSISNAGSTANVLSLIHTGNGNALSANSTISVNHSANRMAADFQITNPSNVLPALNVSHAGSGSTIMASNSGTGVALTASNSDATNTNLSLHAYHNGLGTVARFQTNLGTNNNPTIYTSTGGLSNAAYFESTNATNSSPVITISHLGSGNAITANAPIQATAFVGDGSGLTNLPQLTLPFNGASASATTSMDVTNFSNGLAASFVNSGTGSAAQFLITNAGSSQPVVQISSTGTGNAISTNRPIQALQFIGDGSLLTNLPSLTLPFTGNSGTGATSLDVTNTSTGSAGYFALTNVSNGSPSLSAYTAGTGYALNVQTNNASNSFPAININHGGTGNAITANRPIQATQFIGDGSLLTNLPAGNGWGLTGNTSTDPATNFIGTSDNQEVVFKANNVEGIRIYPSGQVGMGSVPAAAKLAVGSTTRTLGVYGDIQTVSGGQNKGVWGNAMGSTTQNFGVYGSADLAGSNGAIGVYGEGVGVGSADAFGVYGVTNNFTATTGKAYGLFGSAINGSENWAGFFQDGNVHINNGLSFGTPGTFGTSGQVLTSQGNGVAPTWSNPTVGANSITNTEIVDNTIVSADLSTSININTSGSITASSFTGDGAGLTNLPTTGWGLSGNTGTGNYLGTSDATDLSIRTNFLERILVQADGRIGMNTTPTTGQLSIASNAFNSAIIASTNFSTAGAPNRGLEIMASNSSLNNYGVYATGISNPGDGTGVYGEGSGNGTTYGVQAVGSGTGAVNYGLHADASTPATVNFGVYGTAINGGTNWAGYFAQGNVHIANGLSVGIAGTFGTTGQVLTSQGPGTAPIWSAGGWSTAGNTGTGTEFIGTTNDQPVNFRQNNQKAGLIDISTNGNTFFGYHSGLNNTGVTHSTAFGHQALLSNGTGTRNTAIGFQAIFSSPNGNNNTALGWQALASNTGNNNVGVGHQANGSAAAGSNNTAVGYNALSVNTSGSNTAVGYQALDANVTGTSNTAIGSNADVSSSTLTNATAIGADAIVNDNNTVMLGSPGTYVAVGGSVRQGMLSVSHNGSADPAGIFGVTNASNGDAAIMATTLGAGNAADFSNQNAGNANAVVSISNFGSGPSLFASTYVQAGRYVASSSNASANVDIIQSGTGGAGTFQISNAASGTAALLATTNGVGSGLVVNVSNGSNTQPGLEINHSGNSAIGLSINGGTLKYSTATVGTPGLISVKAGVYTITATGSFTLPSAIAGETCLVYNNSGGGLSGDLTNVANGTVRQFVFVGGAWRIVN